MRGTFMRGDKSLIHLAVGKSRTGGLLHEGSEVSGPSGREHMVPPCLWGSFIVLNKIGALAHTAKAGRLSCMSKHAVFNILRSFRENQEL